MPNLHKMYQTNGLQMPHAGEMVAAAMAKRNMSKAELARQLDIHPIGINRYLNQNTLHAALLWKIGQVLNYNFFEELSKQFPLVEEKSLADELQKQVVDLQKENELYKNLLAREQK